MFFSFCFIERIMGIVEEEEKNIKINVYEYK